LTEPAGVFAVTGAFHIKQRTNGLSTGVISCRRAAPVFYILLLISIACCTHLTPPVPSPHAGQCPPEDELLAAVRVTAPPVLKAIAKIKVESPDENFSVKELIVAQKPNRLRLETLSPLGQPGFYAATDGQELSLFAPSENTFYHGSSTPHNLGLVIPLHLALEDMVSVIRGCVPVIHHDAHTIRCTANENGYVMRLEGSDERTTQVLTLSGNDLRVVSSETYVNDGLAWSVNYADYEITGSMAFPRTVTVSLPREGTTVRISYKKVEFLPEIDSSLFRLSAPRGATIVPLE
jgi:outer membrane lipoprotein-sorting protein